MVAWIEWLSFLHVEAAVVRLPVFQSAPCGYDSWFFAVGSVLGWRVDPFSIVDISVLDDVSRTFAPARGVRFMIGIPTNLALIFRSWLFF